MYHAPPLATLGEEYYLYFSKHKINMYTFVQPRGGVSIFPLKHKSAMYTFVQQREGGGGGWVPKEPKSQKYVKMCIHVCTFVT